MSELAASGLCKRFGGVRAVNDVSFSIAAGEILALIGPNGAGKSTCFNLISGQLRPDAGRVRLKGRDVTGMKTSRLARLGVGRTFQITATFPSMTVRENIQMAYSAQRGRSLNCWSRLPRLDVAEADHLLDRVKLSDESDRLAGVLSYGDLKRLELAMSLAGTPSVLLMDEPTAGMAQADRVALMDLVRTLAIERRLAVLFTEHDMDVVFRIADRIVVLNRGVCIAEGDPVSIRTNERVREIYLGPANGAH